MSKSHTDKNSFHTTLPDTNISLETMDLDSPIEIYRDAYGIPHIKAITTHDAFFGQGFATAQDRLWQMDYDRHRAYGRSAEYIGEIGVHDDILMRKFQLSSKSQDDYSNANQKTKHMLEAYSKGVNFFISTTKSLPVEYKIIDSNPTEWQPWDCIGILKVRHVLMGTLENKLWRAEIINELGLKKATDLFLRHQTGHLVIIPPSSEYKGLGIDIMQELGSSVAELQWLKDPDGGSNNWAISGSKTASGKPLLAGDPHRNLETPNVYYQNHISCSAFDAIGLSFPGCPGFPHFGHNKRVAWCVTHAQADCQDLYIEKFDHDDSTTYEFNGTRLPAEIKEELICVREGEPIPVQLVTTHHGPVISGNPDKGYGIALKYPGNTGQDRTTESIRTMLESKSIDELDESMYHWSDPSNNFVFADVEGDIGYLNRGKIPVRDAANHWIPVPGWDSKYEWSGYIPFDELVRSRNPEIGYIATANNKIVGDNYPHYIAIDYAPEYRARRITNLINSIDKATVEDMATIHDDKISIPANTYLGLISSLESLKGDAKVAKEILEKWDCNMNANENAPTIYTAFRQSLHFELLAHLMGVDFAKKSIGHTGRITVGDTRQFGCVVASMALTNDISWLPPNTTWKQLISLALSKGIEYLRENYGDDMNLWKWGLVHYTQPSHSLSSSFPHLASQMNPPSFQMGGDGDTPLAAGYSPANPFTVGSTSIARYIFDLSNWNNSLWITPLGSSGHPGSKHYSDQAAIWSETKFISMLYDWQIISSTTESYQKLDPLKNK